MNRKRENKNMFTEINISYGTQFLGKIMSIYSIKYNKPPSLPYKPPVRLSPQPSAPAAMESIASICHTLAIKHHHTAAEIEIFQTSKTL